MVQLVELARCVSF
ncbi:TPA: hypothetical protein P7O85_003287 [Escherichia coli]|nr:hypothetical protein [Escherichia coli]